MENRNKFLMLWEATDCSKQLGDDDQTAQSTLLSDRRTQLQHRSVVSVTSLLPTAKLNGLKQVWLSLPAF